MDSILVSTDCKKVEWCVAQYRPGIDGLLFRPKKLATAKARVMDTMKYHCRELVKETDRYDIVIMHHATAPLVTYHDIDAALRYFEKKQADFVVSMCPSDGIGVCRPVPADGLVKGWFPKELVGLNRQEIEPAYQLDNNIYIGKWDIFYHGLDYWNTNIYAFKMPRNKCADIDTEEDFQMAEIMHRRLR